MDEFTPQELEEMTQAISQAPPDESQIPLRPPGSYQEISKIALSPLEGEKPRPLKELTAKERAHWEDLKASVEVIFGKTKLTLKELSALQEGHLLPLDALCDDLVDIYVNGSKIGRGEIVAIDDQLGVRIATFTKP